MGRISELIRTDKQQIDEAFNQIKAEGNVRSSRIARILRSALTESLAELKAGATTVTPTAKTVKGSVAQLIRKTSKELAAKAKNAWNDGNLKEGWRDWFQAEIQTAAKAMEATWLEKKRSAVASDEIMEPDRLNSAPDSNI